MTEEELRLEKEAFEFIKANGRMLIEQFCVSLSCHPVTNPISLFMAGSPGAGKTEVSQGLIKRFNDVPIRVDADEIRQLCPGYTGLNAHLFQKAANKGVNILYDHALHNGINCVMDGTFAYGGASENIERSLKHKRKVEIWFVYQDPIKSWELTKAREAHETRHVSKEVFIKAFFDSRNNVRTIKESFKKKVEVNILIKDYETKAQDLYLNVSVTELDRIIDNRYSEEELRCILI